MKNMGKLPNHRKYWHPDLCQHLHIKNHHPLSDNFSGLCYGSEPHLNTINQLLRSNSRYVIIHNNINCTNKLLQDYVFFSPKDLFYIFLESVE